MAPLEPVCLSGMRPGPAVEVDVGEPVRGPVHEAGLEISFSNVAVGLDAERREDVVERGEGVPVVVVAVLRAVVVQLLESCSISKFSDDGSSDSLCMTFDARRLHRSQSTSARCGGRTSLS